MRRLISRPRRRPPSKLLADAPLLGFIQPSEEHVNEPHRRMQADGLAAAPCQQNHAWTIQMRAPAGFAVEVLS